MTHNPDDLSPVEVFSGDQWQTGLLKTLLEDAGIEAFIQDAIMGTLNPWYTAPGGAGAIRVFVAYKDHIKARQVVGELEQNLK
jgi:hypothetical protein